MSFDRPFFLYGILLIFPAIVIIIANYKNFAKNLGSFYTNRFHLSFAYKNIQIKLVFRIVCWSLAWIFLCIASSGPYFGKKNVLVQKTSSSVSFIFDISYSMMAQDVILKGENITRLEAARRYAFDLLSRMQGTALSVVLTKGESILTIPLTDDFNIVYSLLEKLSPQLISSAGSNLSSGFDLAINSFPSQAASTNCIVFFTDGQETTQSLFDSTLKALEYGINVVIIGFGSTEETDVLSGNGTIVKSALQEASLKNIQSLIEEKHARDKTLGSFLYVNSLERSSAVQAIKMMQPFLAAQSNKADILATVSAYDSKPAERHHTFLLLSLLFFLLGLFIYQFAGFVKNSFFLIIFSVFFTSCSIDFKSSFKLLEGSIFWNQKNYEKAAIAFLEVGELAGEEEQIYADFGLATTYLMLNEFESAVELLDILSHDTTNDILFGRYYNLGVISYQNGEYNLAAQFFKDALAIDKTNVNAIVNLELVMQQNQKNQSQEQQSSADQMGMSSQENPVQQSIFSVIKENGKNQWKNQPQQNDSSVLDY
ncbi:MAG: VWA domain-containing protein [Treponemataceae bacterium]